MTCSGKNTGSDCADSHRFSQQAGRYDGQGDGGVVFRCQDACWMDEEHDLQVVMGHRDLPLPVPSPEGWEAEKCPGAGKLQ